MLRRLSGTPALAAAPPPPPEMYGVRLFTNEVRTVLSVLAGVGLFGGIVAAVGYRNDAHVQRLEEKLLHAERSAVQQLAGLKAAVNEQVDGASNTMRAEVAGVRAEAHAEVAGVRDAVTKQVDGASTTMRAAVAGVRAEARAAALEVLKDYGVAVAGGKAGSQ